MPIYEFKCKNCGEIFEEFRYSSDSDIEKDKEIKCPVCGTPWPERLFSVFNPSGSSGCGGDPWEKVHA